MAVRKSEGRGDERDQELRKPGILPLATSEGVAAWARMLRRSVRRRWRGWWDSMVILDGYVGMCLYMYIWE